jgi:malate synthase
MGAYVEILGDHSGVYAKIVTPEAVEFVVDLVQKFRPRVAELLERRETVQADFDAGKRPHFLPETKHIRDSDWKVAKLPNDLLDRRVEITGPVDRKMIINALNSGARVFMADFEDSNSPTWSNLMDGQVNLKDAVRRNITYDAPNGKHYKLSEKPAVLMVRPRGWHLEERHILVDSKPAPAGLVDFGFFLFHNARALLNQGSGPYFYLPKLENHLEARLWNDVFVHAQRELDLPLGTIKATVLIETITAAFEIDEILYELKDHSSGLNCGRWDYIFSFIKKFRNDPNAVMPDRGEVGMSQPFMKAYSELVVKTCHRRGVHAMGGMAAQIPIKGDPAANEAALAKVRVDKEREVKAGHDGTWVAHPGLVSIAMDIFDREMTTPNQISNLREDVHVSEEDLLRIPTGLRTWEGLRHNIRVGVLYLESWLRGVGCVPIYNLMEDAATAEICRTQVWQWLKHGATLEGEVLSLERFHTELTNEMSALETSMGDAFKEGEFKRAIRLFDELCTSNEYQEFLTLPAYGLLPD